MTPEDFVIRGGFMTHGVPVILGMSTSLGVTTILGVSDTIGAVTIVTMSIGGARRAMIAGSFGRI